MQELERDHTVMVMGEDVGHYGGSYKARAASQPHARLPLPLSPPLRPGDL